VEPSGHRNGVDQRADAIFSLNPAAEAAAGATSMANAANRKTR
jgi:hypothetical protein